MMDNELPIKTHVSKPLVSSIGGCYHTIEHVVIRQWTLVQVYLNMGYYCCISRVSYVMNMFLLLWENTCSKWVGLIFTLLITLTWMIVKKKKKTKKKLCYCHQARMAFVQTTPFIIQHQMCNTLTSSIFRQMLGYNDD